MRSDGSVYYHILGFVKPELPGVWTEYPNQECFVRVSTENVPNRVAWCIDWLTKPIVIGSNFDKRCPTGIRE
ncbi:hypothetical protein CEXT_478281 [Caerostris extrusa]|uniref:Uncharacterized protein n=1 Tax=Caerostris extrusa TaxID=172846 RepID=A0AAV4TAR6_CAEEX|nr:hypothetical protein CEXT_478281 [Caerostris extrusa]